MYLCNTEQIRSADRLMIEDRKFPGILLMENAGRLSAEWMMARFPENQAFLILAGPGNNGGDGLVIARILWLAGRKVEILYASDPEKYKGDAKLNFDFLQTTSIPQKIYAGNRDASFDQTQSLSGDTVLVDALLGTGITEKTGGSIAEIISVFSKIESQCVAVDLPSGLSADTGFLTNESIPAVATLTFHQPKICHYVYPAAELCGEIVVLDIGIWPDINAKIGVKREIWNSEKVAKTYSELIENLTSAKNTHKGDFGHVLVVGGNMETPGAISMTGRSVLKSGAGLVTIFCPGGATTMLGPESSELMIARWGKTETEMLSKEALAFFKENVKGKSAVAIGPGLGCNKETAGFLKAVLPWVSVPLILDADGLNILASHPELWKILPENTVLTPHPGEMARLCGLSTKEIQQHRLEFAEKLSAEKGVTVVLKGANTIIAHSGGQTTVNPTGNPGMSTAGAGDVLTGCIAGFLGRGFPPNEATTMAVYIHGLAGDRVAQTCGESGVTALAIMDQLGPALLHCLQDNQT